jgi:redox-sensitive bicupin YhaK (pirin superfamily)
VDQQVAQSRLRLESLRVVCRRERRQLGRRSSLPLRLIVARFVQLELCKRQVNPHIAAAERARDFLRHLFLEIALLLLARDPRLDSRDVLAVDAVRFQVGGERLPGDVPRHIPHLGDDFGLGQPRALHSGMDSVIHEIRPLGFPWETVDPFLFCVHHDDAYPAGNAQLGPASPLVGRNIGQDFEGKDGWRMYHGQLVPGFPQHPHRGFETVTLVRRGLIDHSDSLGATARFGQGDAQWLTAGAGIVHCEMFPLLQQERPNPLELFQIWLNLPSDDKMAPPHFAMLWNSQIPQLRFQDDAERATEVSVVAGRLDGRRAPPPPPRSWAARADTDVAIWSIRMQAGARWQLPAADARSRRTLYFFRGPTLQVADRLLSESCAIHVQSDANIMLQAGDGDVEVLLLQGRPIGEPVVQYGPFVMNTRTEIQEALQDYQRTRFGGWPWSQDEPVHARNAGRFAKHADGRTERVED